MNEPKKPANIEDIFCQIFESVQSDTLSNDDLVHIIELCGNFLNLQTISDYARCQGVSYNSAKHNREVREIFNVKFVIDNNFSKK